MNWLFEKFFKQKSTQDKPEQGQAKPYVNPSITPLPFHFNPIFPHHSQESCSCLHHSKF